MKIPVKRTPSMPARDETLFHKLGNQRWFTTAIIALAVACGLVVGLGITFSLALAEEEPSGPNMDSAVSEMDAVETTTIPAAQSYTVSETETVPATMLTVAPMAPIPDVEPSTEFYAFYVNWGDEAYQSLVAHVDEIDVLIPMWYHLDSTGKLTVGDPVEQAEVMALVRRRNPEMQVMPLVNNYDKASESWNAPEMSKLLASPAKRAEMAQHIVDTLGAAGFDGVNVDFENFTAADKANLSAFMEELYPRAKKADLVVSMDVLAKGSAYDHARLARSVDFMVPMMYDQHWKTSGPGPISSQTWFQTTLAGFYEKVPHEKVVPAFGVYTYDYGAAGQRAKSYTWAEAVELAAVKGATIELDAVQKNAHFSYSEGGVTHNVWMLDAVSAFNQIAWATKTEPMGFAMWRLGAEDPGVWTALAARDNLGASAAAKLNDSRRTVRYDESINLIVEEEYAR